jgi:hypothetical protein
MTDSNPLEFLADASGSLGHVFSGRWVITPGSVSLDQVARLGRREAGLRLSYADRVEVEEPRSRLLERFVALRNGTGEQVLAFAKSDGALHLCADHEMPITRQHNCELGEEWFEPIRRWQRLADQIHATLDIAAAARSERHPRLDAWDRLGWPAPDEPSPEFYKRATQTLINEWLLRADVAPYFEWFETDSTVRIGGVGFGVFGAVVTELMVVANGKGNLDTCSECGAFYAPKRRPHLGKRRYCSECHDRGVPGRDAQRAKRARERAASGKRVG